MPVPEPFFPKWWNFLRRNVGEHPSSATSRIHNLCQVTLKLLWWLTVAGSPAKTLSIDVSFISAAPLSNPLSPQPLSLATQLSMSSLWQDHLRAGIFLHLCVYVCLFPSLLQWAGADACVNKMWAGMKMCKVV